MSSWKPFCFKLIETIDQLAQHTQSSIQNLETQVGQLARGQQGKQQGSLPSDTVINPKEQCKSIALRSGKEVELPKNFGKGKEVVEDEGIIEEEVVEEKKNTSHDEFPTTSHDPPPQPQVKAYVPPIPYPQRLKKQKVLTISKLGVGEVRPTHVTLQLADKSIKYPRGVMEDVLVKVERLYFPVDFVILEMEEDVEIPLLLGDEQVVFDIEKATTRPIDVDRCLMVEIVELLVEEFVKRETPKEPLEACIVHGAFEEGEDEKVAEYALHLNSQPMKKFRERRRFEELGEGKPRLPPSVEKPHKLELKQLPEYLRYAFLGESLSLPVIISASLSKIKEEKLLRVLRSHKKAIGWSISNIKGLSPSICMHKILMEEEFKPTVEHQRRLNPNM
ncbi:hypothetical protein QYF36_024922 [Acer negundo]|nr:hypothetical protein QYF36_024922 [Acer negundo]